MDFGSATFLLFVVAGGMAFLGMLFFIRPRWFLAWLKGSLAFGLVFVGVALFLLAWDLRSYYNLAQLETVASVTVRQTGPQQWKLSLVSEAMPEGRQVYELRGDQWQLDARVIRFSGPLQWLGLQPAFKFERLSGRYLSLEEARSQPQTIHGLGSDGWVDFWALDQRVGLPLLESQFGSATFMPLRNNAVYDVLLGQGGLSAVPVNEEAKSAVTAWQ
jgi:hypothetical protein